MEPYMRAKYSVPCLDVVAKVSIPLPLYHTCTEIMRFTVLGKTSYNYSYLDIRDCLTVGPHATRYASLRKNLNNLKPKPDVYVSVDL